MLFLDVVGLLRALGCRLFRCGWRGGEGCGIAHRKRSCCVPWGIALELERDDSGLGDPRYYHASVMPKKTCYMMFLSGKALASVAPGGAERRWLTTLKQRAEATFAAECNVFRRHVREQRR